MEHTGVEFADVTYRLPSAGPSDPGRTLLDRISFKLAPGSTTALLGRSGSGKTTLLRMVNGLALPTTGTVTVADIDTRDNPVTLRRSIGYVIQEGGLFPHMTVAKNVGMALELAGRPKLEIRARAEELLALVGLNCSVMNDVDRSESRHAGRSLVDSGIADRFPWQLSGGQRQRVGLARALANDPPVLLMDEPFGALDPITRTEMQTMLSDLLTRLSKTTLLVTHDLNEALYLADRVVFLEAGRIVADLPSIEVLGSNIPLVKTYVSAINHTRKT